MQDQVKDKDQIFDVSSSLALTKRIVNVSILANGFMYILLMLNLWLSYQNGLYLLGSLTIALVLALNGLTLIKSLKDTKVKVYAPGISMILLTLLFEINLGPNGQKSLAFILFLSIIAYMGELKTVVISFFIFIFYTIFEGAFLPAGIEGYFNSEQFSTTNKIIFYSILTLQLGSLYSLLGIRKKVLGAVEFSAEKIEGLDSEYAENLEFAKKISEGDYNYKPTSSNQLSEVLDEMKERISSTAEEERKRNWVIAGTAETGELVRKFQEDHKSMPNEIIAYLVKYMNANQGAVFFVEKDELDINHFRLKGAYAYERTKFMDAKIDIEEGLLGQIYKEKGLVYLKEVPESYVHITSGLGESTPTEVVVCPMTVDGRVVGAIELASFDTFEDYHLELVEKVSEIVGSAVLSAIRNEETKTLLSDSKQMTEEMRAQEEEMRQNMEELEATQEDLQRKNEEREKYEVQIRKYQAFLENILEKIPYPVYVKDKNHKYFVANEAFSEMSGFSKEDLMYAESEEIFDKDSPFYHLKDNEIFKTRKKTTVQGTVSKNGKSQEVNVTRSIILDKDENEFLLVTAV